MTIEQLLNCTAKELAAMSDAQLNEYFKPVLNVTRPSAEAKKNAEIGKTGVAPKKRSIEQRSQDILKELGLTLPGMDTL